MMMVNRRRVCGGKNLPYDYEVEWIQANGNCRFVTNTYFDYSTEYVSRFYFGNIQSRALFTGVFGSSGNGYLGIDKNGYVEITYNSSSSYNVRNKECTFIIANQTKKCNGTNINYTSTFVRWFDRTSYPLTIFGYQMNVDGVDLYETKFISAYVRNSGIVVADFIPVVKNNIGYIFDKVNSQLISSVNPNNLIIGPRV